MAQIISITFDHGGFVQTLTTDKDVRDAILRDALRRDTPVSVVRSGMAPVTLAAGQVEELARIMDEYGRPAGPAYGAAAPAPQPQPHVSAAYYELPERRGGGNKVLVPLLAGVAIVLLAALVFLLLRNQSSDTPANGSAPAVNIPVATGPSASAVDDPSAAPQPAAINVATPADESALASLSVSRVTFGTRTSGDDLLDERDSPPAGPTNFVAKFYYAGALPPQGFTCQLSGRNTLSGQLNFTAGSAWCSWGNLLPGQYQLQFLVNGRSLASRNVTVGGGAPPAQIAGGDDASQRSSAEGVIRTYYARWAPANDVSWVYSAYTSAGDLRYFDKIWTQQMVANGQSETINRFPYRTYSPNSINSDCTASSQTCRVTGSVTYDWANSATNEHRSGTKRFEFWTRRQPDGTTVITSERWLG